jgi:hypothetical protein
MYLYIYIFIYMYLFTYMYIFKYIGVIGEKTKKTAGKKISATVQGSSPAL